MVVERRFKQALRQAEGRLASLDIVRGRPVSVKGLRGWLFEQAVRTCLEEELERRGISVRIVEQASIGGRASGDFLIGHVAVEVKVAGFFDDVGERYLSYRRAVEAKGWTYLYLTLDETYQPYVGVARRTFGRDRAFFLRRAGEWERFVRTVVRLLQARQPAVERDIGKELVRRITRRI